MKRFYRAVGLITATMTILLAPAAAAQAEPFALDITNVVMDLGGLEGVKAIDSANGDPPATLDGELTDGTVTVPKAGFVFPEKSITDPVAADINMEANQDMTGTWDEATGKLVLNVDLKATVEVLGSTCVISPIVLTLTTDNADPYLGVEFGTGLGGPGAIGGSWTSLPPVTGGGSCGVVAGLIAGPGGIWMAQNILEPQKCPQPDNPRCSVTPGGTPSAAPRIITSPETTTDSTSATFTFAKGSEETETVSGYRCSLDGAPFEPCDSGTKTYTGLAVGSHKFEVKSHNEAGDGPAASKTWSVTRKQGPDPDKKPAFGQLTIKPKNKAVKRGKKATLTASISNTGDAAADGVKICVTAPKKLVSVKKCANVGSVAAGASKSVKFKVTVKKKAKKGKKATLKFTATGNGLAKKTASAKVKVK